MNSFKVKVLIVTNVQSRPNLPKITKIYDFYDFCIL